MRWSKLAATSVLFLVRFVLTAGAEPSVSKVEPPNWWPGHSLNPVQLLIRGSGLQGCSITATGGLRAGPPRVNAAGTYVIVDVTIPRGAHPGSYPLQIRTTSGTVSAPFRLEAPLSRPGRFQGFSSDDVIYLIMPDRFANGDSSNDDPAISRGLYDRGKDRYYHGGDLQGILDHLPYLKSLGITALWLTPVYDNANQPNTRQAVNGEPIADYHGYGATDYYGVEEHFGTIDLLRRLVDTAHQMGLKVIQDQVANHVGPNHPWVNDPPKPTWFHGTAAHHINETWQIWTLPDPHASPELKRDVLDGWFVDALPDLNQEDPDVAKYEIQNALWWVGTAGSDGIRQDTLPYVPRRFWRDWSAAINREYPNLRFVGEVFDRNPAVPSFFQGGRPQPDGIDTGIHAVFDFPTFFDIREVFAKGGSLETIAQTLAEDRLYADPASLVTFLGNHDVVRFLGEPGATIENLKLAFTFLLTFRGTPSIYYGDEIAMRGGNDPDNRRDFPGGWPQDTRSAFDPKTRTAEENAVFDHVRKLTSLRASVDALRRGTLTELAVSKDYWVYVRQGARSSAIVAINNGTAIARINFEYGRSGTWRASLEKSPDLQIKDGRASLELPPHSAEIYVSSSP